MGPSSDVRLAPNKAELKAIAANLVAQLDTLPADMRRELHDILARSGAIHGFRFPLKAPAHLLRVGIETAGARPENGRMLLMMWSFLHLNRIEEVRAYIAENGFEPSGESMDEARRRVAKEWPDLGIEGDLALLYLGAFPAVAADAGEQHGASEETIIQPAMPDRLRGWLRELNELSPDAEEWHYLEQFVDMVRALGTAQAQRAQRAELREELSRLLKQVQGDGSLSTLDPGCLAWSASVCSDEDIEEALQRLEEVRTTLGRYREASNRTTVSFVERRQVLHDLDEIVAGLEGHSRRLDALLRDEPSPPPSSPETDPRAEVEVNDGRLPEPVQQDGTPISTSQPEALIARGDLAAAIRPAAPEASPEVSPMADPSPTMDVGGVGQEVMVSDEPISQATSISPPTVPLGATGTDQTTPTATTEPTTAPIEAGLIDAPSLAAVVPPVPESRDAFIWRALATGDESGAYWYARASEATGCPVALPSWLLGALAGSRLMERGEQRAADDLTSITRDNSPVGPEAHAVAVAAALLPALCHPEADAGRWLTDLSGPLVAANPVVQAVRTFSGTGLALGPEDARGFQDQASLDRRIREQAADVCRWLEQGRVRNVSYQLASDVLHHMSSEHGELATILAPAIADRRQEWKHAAERLRPWNDRKYITERIHETQRAIYRGTKFRPIQWQALEQLIRDIRDLVDKAESWCHLAAGWKDGAAERDWAWAQVSYLVQSLSEATPRAREALDNHRTGGDPAMCAVAATLLRSLAAIEGYLKGAWATEQGLPPFPSRDLKSWLAFRLLWYPGLPLKADPDGVPTLGEDGWPSLLARLSDAVPPPDAAGLLDRWLALEDFRWVDALIAGTDDGVRAALEERAVEARQRAEASLLDGVEAVSRELEQAIVDGGVDMDARPAFAGELESLRQESSKRSVSFGALQERLRMLRQELDRRRAASLQPQLERWAQLREGHLKDRHDEGSDHLTSLMEEAMRRRDVALVDELLAEVERATPEQPLESLLQDLRARDGEQREARDAFADFLKAREDLNGLVQQRYNNRLSDLAQDVRAQRAPQELGLRNLPQPRLLEVGEALAAWRELKQPGRSSSDGVESVREGDYSLELWRLMRYVGFRMDPDSRYAFTKKHFGRGWAHWVGSMAAESPSTTQQFGSDRRGRFDLLLLWERPGIITVDKIYTEAVLDHAAPLIVLYLARLLPRQWQDVVRHAYRTGRQALVLDELLLLFLARAHDLRLDPFFRCTLPATRVNPYVPFAAGQVPEEMFVGRDRLIRALQDERGPAVVYGGRQLGKSSLLRQVHRRFHDPGQARQAVLLDIRTVGEPGELQDPSSVWTRIGDGLAGLDLPREQRPRPNERPQSVLRRLLRDPEQRILILLDEADMFLEADRALGFRTVGEIKSLMEDSGRRLKVVFAGLHNVRRFGAVPNQPFAHLGTPIVVGPLEAKDAISLIRRMELLGFRLSDDVVLKILSLTNYHPALIQLFCHDLVEALRSRAMLVPPYRVSATDVDEVSRSPKLRERFRERFVWTLDLDPHYGVLARALVNDQMGERGDFARAYSLVELQRLAADWWPQGFQNLQPDHFRSYIEELSDLGVLLSDGAGGYRLRSPNTVRLLGSRADIEAYLLRANNQPADPAEALRAAREHLHPRLRDRPAQYSPLTQGQLDRLGIGRAGVTLLFGSRATGIEDIPATLGSLSGMERAVPFRFIERSVPLAPGQIASQARQLQEHLPVGEHAVVALPLAASDPSALCGQVETAFAVVERIKARSLRLLLLGAAAPLAAWAAIPPDVREPLEARAGIVVLERWNEQAIDRMLEEQNVPSGRAPVERLLQATGGYHRFIAMLLARYETGDVPDFAQVVTQFNRDVDEALPGPAGELSAPLDLPPAGIARAVLEAVCSLDTGEGVGIDVLTGLIADATVDDIAASVLTLQRLGLLQGDSDVLRPVPFACRLLAAP